jgi:hypothetical protein
MLAAIDFYNEAALEADEISDKCANPLLPAELVAVKLAIAQTVPKDALCKA